MITKPQQVIHNASKGCNCVTVNKPVNEYRPGRRAQFQYKNRLSMSRGPHPKHQDGGEIVVFTQSTANNASNKLFKN